MLRCWIPISIHHLRRKSKSAYSSRMATLRQFLSERREQIQAQMKTLRAELREIEAATAALPDATSIGESRAAVARERRRGPTLKVLAVQVLKHYPDGLEANDIRQKIAETHGIEIKRSSMSPQLSRLAKDGIVRLAGRRWLLLSEQAAPIDETVGFEDRNQEEGRAMEASPGPGMP